MRLDSMAPQRQASIWMALAVTTLAWLTAGPVQAEPFKDGDLFSGKSMVQRSSDRRFFTGAHFQVAPVKAVVQSLVKSQVDAYTKQNPGAAQVVDYVQYVDPVQVKAMADSGQVEQFKAQLKAELKAQGQLTPEQEKAVDQIDSQKLKMLAEVVSIYNEPEPTTTFALEPYAGVIFGPAQLTAQVPLAGFYTSKDSKVVLGNPGLDLRLGHGFGSTNKSIGFSIGGSAWAPLGSMDSDTIALSNVRASPRFMHDYFSWTGYGILAAELAIFDFSVRGEFVEMRPFSDKNKDATPLNDLKTMRYVDTGAAILADLGVLGLSVELDGMFNVANAKAFNNTFFITTGARFYLRKLQIGLAVQAPISKAGDGVRTPIGGVNLGSPASFNAMINAQLTL